MSAAAVALLAEAEAVGVRLRVAGNGNVKAAGVPLPLLARLRQHKGELLELLRGHLCRYCAGPIEELEPGWVAFAEGTAAHLSCHDAAEVARIRARVANCFAPEVLADEAEIAMRGEELP